MAAEFELLTGTHYPHHKLENMSSFTPLGSNCELVQSEQRREKKKSKQKKDRKHRRNSMQIQRQLNMLFSRKDY